MDALSSLKLMTGAPGGAGLPDSVQQLAASANQAIPSAELQALTPSSDTPLTVTGPEPAGSGFESMLGNFVGDVAQKQAAATDAVSGLLSGKNVSLHQAMISMEEANVSFQMMVEIRNKLLDSYQELMRMQI
jgi:flagellar hook-basal body complex protein FliE